MIWLSLFFPLSFWKMQRGIRNERCGKHNALLQNAKFSPRLSNNPWIMVHQFWVHSYPNQFLPCVWVRTQTNKENISFLICCILLSSYYFLFHLFVFVSSALLLPSFETMSLSPSANALCRMNKLWPTPSYIQTKFSRSLATLRKCPVSPGCTSLINSFRAKAPFLHRKMRQHVIKSKYHKMRLFSVIILLSRFIDSDSVWNQTLSWRAEQWFDFKWKSHFLSSDDIKKKKSITTFLSNSVTLCR